MSCNHVGLHNFCFKKGSRTVKDFYLYSDEAYSVVEDISAYDTATMYFLDKRAGTSLFTVTGTITQITAKLEFIISTANTAALANNTSYYYVKLSNSGDATLDWIFLEGNAEFLN